MYVATYCSIRLRKSTAAKLHQFTESDKDQLHKIREDTSGGRCSVFTRKALLNESLLRIQQTGEEPLLESLILSFVRTLCVKRWLLECMREREYFRKGREALEKMVMSYSREIKHNVKRRASTQRSHCKTSVGCSVGGSCAPNNTLFAVTRS